MKYYFIFPNACGEFDEQTIYTRRPFPEIMTQNIGLVFDWWPPDDLFQSSPELFCTERLKHLLETDFQKFSGIRAFEKVERVSTGANWIDRYADARPGYYWRITIAGTALKNDIAYWPNTLYLVISERLLTFLSHNHVTEALGSCIDGDAEYFFKNYIEKQKKTNYSTLPPKLFTINATS